MGAESFHTIDNTWYHRPPNIPLRTSAGGIVVRRDTSDPVPLIAFAREGHIPLFVLPKGGVEPNESLEQAARREITEEIGITDLQMVADLGTKERLSYEKNSWLTVYYFLFITNQVEGTPTDTAFHHGLWWFPLSELPPMLWPEQQELIQSNYNLISQV